MAAGLTGPVALAVSGGSDSLSLLLLANGWAARRGRTLVVLSVDHGLRSEAGEEARSVVRRAAALGHSGDVLRWSPDRKGQDAARTARHRLLAEAARAQGANLLLLGHTASDVEETLLMRLARPTRLAAAAGPQPVSVSPVWPEGLGLLIGRPLIGCKREDLRRFLVDADEDWIDDPSNVSDAYERVRVRRLLAALGPGRLARIARDAVRLRAAEDLVLSAWLRRQISVDDAGLIEARIPDAPTSPVLLRRWLGILLQAGAGTARAVSVGALSALAEDIRSGGPVSRLTLGGAWVQRRGESLLIGRDPGEVAAGWTAGVWDGRYMPGDDERPAEALPFLVRHGVPDTGRREIVSQRLVLWADALERGAIIGAQLSDAGDQGPRAYQTPRLSPFQR